MKKRIHFAFLLWSFAAPIFAQSEYFDPSFGQNGEVNFLFQDGNGESQLNCVARQSDGKIVAWGESYSGGTSVARFNQDGTLDTSFGNNGQLNLGIPTMPIQNIILIQPDDKILLSGGYYGSFLVARLMPDGDFDPSFGVNGICTFSVWTSANLMAVTDIKLQPDGKILVAGYPFFDETKAMVARIKANGTVDSPFGSFGKIVLTASDMPNPDALAVNRVFIGLAANNSIIVSGTYYKEQDDFFQQNFGFTCSFYSGGDLNTNFGTNGFAESPSYQSSGSPSYLSKTQRVFPLPQNKYFLLLQKSTITDFTTVTYLTKWNANGSVDTTFADQGYAVLPFGVNNSTDIRGGYLQPDEKVVVYGMVDKKKMLFRYNADGTVDTTFGNKGIIVNDEWMWAPIKSAFMQPDGKIVVASQDFVPSGFPEIGYIARFLTSNFVGLIEAPSVLNTALSYPNPIVGQTLTVAYELSEASPIRIDLIDLQGKILGNLLSVQRQMGKTEENLLLPADLDNGLYFLNIQSDKGNIVVKLSVNRP